MVLVDRQCREDVELGDDGLLEAGRGGRRVVLGPALRLLDDQIDDAQGDLVHGRHLHRRRGRRRLVGVAPQDRGAALGRDDRVDRVLEGDDHVADGDREGPPPSPVITATIGVRSRLIKRDQSGPARA